MKADGRRSSIRTETRGPVPAAQPPRAPMSKGLYSRMQAPTRLCPTRELSEERHSSHLHPVRSTSYDDPLRGKENLLPTASKRSLASPRPMMPLCPTAVSSRVSNSFYQRMEVLEHSVERGTTGTCPKGFEAVF